MIGSIVGSYKITDKIGEGGMGAVFKGVDVMLEREVAIKMLRPELARNPQIVERFRTEAVTLAKLNHPYIATLYSFIRQGDDFFMVMEYVNGDTLDDIIRKSGAMPINRAVALVCQALEGLEHAHNLGIIHRDIKPANMMVTREGTIKVMDFGIARVLGTDRLTKAGHLIGTVEYMAPEQVRGEETDGRSDVYSLGILLYEILTGRVPFTATSEYELMRRQIEDAPTPPRVFAADIPLAVEQVIMRALAKRPEARQQTAGEFREMLQRQVNGSTAPGNSVAPQYTAPATRFGNPLATAPDYPGIPGRTDPTTDPSLKETRLGTDGNIPASSYAPTVTLAPDAHVSTQSPTHSGNSLLSRLNWKHYAGVGAVVLLLVAVPIALIGGKGPDPVAQPQPRTTPPSSTNPAPQQASPPAAAVEVPQRSGPGGQDNTSPQGQQPATGSKPTRKRGTAQTSTPPPKEEKKGGIFDRIKGILPGKKDKKP
jgi:serine/threonine-protein kinase